jgi:hypothetical protein
MPQIPQPPRPSQTPDSASGRVQNLPCNPTTEAKLTAYLDAICAQTPPEVPGTAVQEMRLEMSAHLLSALSANVEMGRTEDEAISQVLTQFGNPPIVARQWKNEWEETLAQSPNAPLWPSLRLAMCVWGLAYAGMLGIGYLFRSYPTMPDLLRVQWTMLGLFGIPVLAGGAIGLLARRRPVLSNAIASVGIHLLYLPIIMFQLNAISPGGWRASLWFAVNPFLLWLPLSSLAAALTAQMRKVSKRRQRAR